MALIGIRRLAIATALSVISIGSVATAAYAVPCDQGPGGNSPTCITVTQISPAQGAALSGTIALSAHATQATPGRGNITHVEFWLYSPTFSAQHPGNVESKVLLSELINQAPATGSLTDGVWNSSWTVQSGSITARDGDYATPGLRTYTLPTTGIASFQIETHVLDAQWDADNPSPGGPPGRSGKKDVTINFTGAPPAPPPPTSGPCVPANSCITVTPVVPTAGATLSGTATLTSNATQTVAARGAITHVEWWLAHPSFVQPGVNDDGRVLIASSTTPSAGTATDGTWTSTWSVPTGLTMVTQNDGAGGACPCTISLPSTGQYTIQTHVLDLQWDNGGTSPGEAPGRSPGVPVTLPLQVPPPPPVVTPPVVTPPVVTPPVVIIPKTVTLIGATITPVATRQLRRGRAGAVIGTITTFRQRRNIPTRGLRLTFQRWNGKHWISLKTVVSAPNGTVVLAVRPSSTTTYRLVFAGTTTFAPARSKAVQIKVV